MKARRPQTSAPVLKAQIEAERARALFETLGVEDLPQNRKRVALVERALQSGVVSRREL